MIHHCSSMSHDCNKCSFHPPFCCGVPGAVYSKIIPKSFLSDSVSSALFSPALMHLIILTWISCLAYKAFIQSIIGLTCSFLFFKKKLSYTLLLHQPTLPNIAFLPCLVFSLMRQIHPFSRHVTLILVLLWDIFLLYILQ